MIVISSHYCAFCDCHGRDGHGYYCLRIGIKKIEKVSVCPFGSCEKWRGSILGVKILFRGDEVEQ